MPEYIYVLTNSSMQGLVKIGKTTNSPLQRMKELQTTGVPTPFQLECAFEVDDCTKREKAAHTALSKHRIEGREFFKLPVETALRKVLPLMGDYTIFFAKSEYRIEALANKLRILEEKRKVQEEQRREQKRQQALTEQERHRRQLAAEKQISQDQWNVHAWYRQEYERLFPTKSVWSFGVWVGGLMLLILLTQLPEISGGKLIFWSVISGWLGGYFFLNRTERMRAKSGARIALDKEREERFLAIREIIQLCPSCNQSLRFKRIQVLANDGYLDFSCPKCGAKINPTSDIKKL